MPDRTISILGYSCAALVVAYLALIIVTVSLAAWQTDLAVEVHVTEGKIAQLENTYYAMVSEIDAANPSSLGLVAPSSVSYAVKAPAPALSRR
ncbi:hypothetical protein KKD81_00960 [Patescibacteria group bacterium]|nr:hypothetical protein [Patescibacteria group bacterium]MBU2159138.1 hypothetical protein [Patescibacteria group bacterium]MBU2220488.1 hypothetical protein [Patescibacteria group bacterium]